MKVGHAKFKTYSGEEKEAESKSEAIEDDTFVDIDKTVETVENIREFLNAEAEEEGGATITVTESDLEEEEQGEVEEGPEQHSYHTMRKAVFLPESKARYVIYPLSNFSFLFLSPELPVTQKI